MKISTKGRYALRLMLDLAEHHTNNPVSVRDVAKRQEISEKYLERIIAELSKAGLVRGIRGAQGGYLLRKKPEDYSVGDILRVMEGSLAPVECVEDKDAFCRRRDTCVTVLVWRKVNDAVNDVVDHITLADLLKWQEEKRAADQQNLLCIPQQ